MEHLGLITIPAYFKQFVNSDINLVETPKLRCPFHKEEQGQSFSYSQEKNTWRCFGACKAGGDVIDMHKLNYRLAAVVANAVLAISDTYDTNKVLSEAVGFNATEDNWFCTSLTLVEQLINWKEGKR